MADYGKVLAAFVGGVVLGVATALLLAPKSGAETRAQILELAHSKGIPLRKEEIEDFVNKVITKLKDYFSQSDLEQAIDEVVAEAQ